MSGEVKNPNEVDTTKVIMKEDLRSELQSVELGPGERRELVLAPTEVMTRPVLTMAGPAEVTVEQIACGHFVVWATPGTVSEYLQGQVIDEFVGPDDPLRVLFVNGLAVKVKINVTLSVLERAGAYRLVPERKT